MSEIIGAIIAVVVFGATIHLAWGLWKTRSRP